MIYDPDHTVTILDGCGNGKDMGVVSRRSAAERATVIRKNNSTTGCKAHTQSSWQYFSATND